MKTNDDVTSIVNRPSHVAHKGAVQAMKVGGGGAQDAAPVAHQVAGRDGVRVLPGQRLLELAGDEGERQHAEQRHRRQCGAPTDVVHDQAAGQQGQHGQKAQAAEPARHDARALARLV